MSGTGLIGFVGNFGGGELVVIVLVALVFLGPDRIPEMARGAGKMLHKFRTMTEGLQSEVSDVLDDPVMKPLRELGEFAARPRQKLTEYALEAEAEARAKKEREAQDRADEAAALEAGTEPSGAVDDASTDEPDSELTSEADAAVDSDDPPREDASVRQEAEARLKAFATVTRAGEADASTQPVASAERASPDADAVSADAPDEPGSMRAPESD